MTKMIDASLFQSTLRLYSDFRLRVLAYGILVILATASALVMDIGYGIPEGVVLLYLAPLIGFLFVVVTVALVILTRGSLRFYPELKREASLRSQQEIIAQLEAGKTLEDLILEWMNKQSAKNKRPYTPYRYTPAYRHRLILRSGSRRTPQNYKRA